MFTNISLFTRFFVVWFFIGNVRSDVFFTNITRDFNDIFKNGFCGKCGEYDAKEEGNSCRCNAGVSSTFMRSERKCKPATDLFKNCLRWYNGEDAGLIDGDQVNFTHKFHLSGFYHSCQLTQLIEFLDSTGEWKPSNISATVLKLLYGVPRPLLSTLKVTEQSAVLAKLSGYVMKLSLNCTRMDWGVDHKCLLFKLAKGQLEVPFCNYTITTMQPSTTATGTPRTATGTPRTTTGTPSTTTVKPTTPDHDPNKGIIAAIAAVGGMLCLILIGVFAFTVYYNKRLQSRNHPSELDSSTVISNSIPQTYRVQEEPLYIELPDVCPSNTHFTGGVRGGKLTPEIEGSGRRLTDALPSRPQDTKENARIESVVDHAYQNDRHELDKQTDGSIVLENPQAHETLSGSRSDSDHLPEAREEEEPHSELHHHPHEPVNGDEEDLDYQGLEERKRAQSRFICPSCNENTDYQRLSRLGHCPHERTEERRQKTASFYESLSHEGAARESLYARPSRGGEIVDGDKHNTNGTPEYAILEPEETEANQGLHEPANHDYSVLEEPEQTCSEVDEDNNKLSEPPSTGEEPEKPGEPSGFVSMDDNPAYALPWKKKDSEEPVRKRSYSM